jgi:hypothetical protein
VDDWYGLTCTPKMSSFVYVQEDEIERADLPMLPLSAAPKANNLNLLDINQWTFMWLFQMNCW